VKYRDVLVAEDRDVEGVEESGERGGGIPLPSRLRGVGERRELRLRGPGGAPAESDFSVFLTC